MRVHAILLVELGAGVAVLHFRCGDQMALGHYLFQFLEWGWYAGRGAAFPTF